MAYRVSTLLRLHKESERQLTKFGIQDHSIDRWMIILGEEFGEACKSGLDGDEDNYEDELIQVAAVALSALENFREQRRNRQLPHTEQSDSSVPV